jgi:dethiobiotin synthetase
LAWHAGRIRELAATHDHVLVEGAGGVLVELDSDGGTLADLGSLLAAAFVVVARPGLGTLNHTALTLEALAARGLDVLGVVLGSWPARPDAIHHSNRQVLGSLRVPVIGALPERASELSPADFRAGAAAWLNGVPA